MNFKKFTQISSYKLINLGVCFFVTLSFSYIYSLEGLSLGILGHFVLNALGIFIIPFGLFANTLLNYVNFTEENIFILYFIVAIFNYIVYYLILTYLEKRNKRTLGFIITFLFLSLNIMIGFGAFL